MSREKMTSWTPRCLKFKVWDCFNNEWITNWQEQAGNSPICFLPEEMMEDDEGPTVQFFDSYNGSSYRFLQYTGLKDKNGKEIYEGDILSDDEVHVLCEDYSMKSLYVVDYADGTYKNPLIYQSLNGSKFFKTEWLDRAKNCDYAEMTIVGNIMENPELIVKA